MPGRRSALLPTVAGCATLAALAAPAPANAALPVANGRYTGPSSQGNRMLLRIDRRHRRTIEEFSGNVRLTCGKLRPIRDWSLTVEVHIHRDGTFTDTFIGPEFLPQLSGPIVVDGARHRAFAVSRTRLTGRFLDRRHAKGNWRVQLLIFGRSVFDDPAAGALDRCDTGVLRWKVKRAP